MKEKIRYCVYFILFGLVLWAFIYVGTHNYQKEEVVEDNIKFSSEYNLVPEDNKFQYINVFEVIDKLHNGNSIIFMGDPTSEWCNKYAYYLYDALKDKDIILYYFNAGELKRLQNKNYYNLIDELKGNLTTTDDSDNNLFTPSLYIIKDGKIVYFNNTTSTTKNNELIESFWTDNEIAKFQYEILTKINE